MSIKQYETIQGTNTTNPSNTAPEDYFDVLIRFHIEYGGRRKGCTKYFEIIKRGFPSIIIQEKNPSIPINI